MIHHTCKTLLHTYSVIPLILTAFLRRNWKCIIRRVHCTCSSWRFEAILPAAGCTRYCCRFLHGFYTHCRSVQPCYPSLSTYVFTVVSWCVTFVARFWSTISLIWLAFCCSCDSNSPPAAVKERCTNKLVSLLCIVLLQNYPMKSYVYKLFTIWYKSYLVRVKTLWRDWFFILPGKIVKLFVNTNLKWSTDSASGNLIKQNKKTVPEELRWNEVSLG